MKKVLHIVQHLIIFVALTIVTQIGGILYVISIISIKKNVGRKRLKRIGLFAGMYVLATFLIVPITAPFFGREKIEESKSLKAHSFFYKLANRNYVRPALHKTIRKIAVKFEQRNSGITLVYLDANFPFFNNFPLLPHLSHSVGKKIDVSLVYENPHQELTNRKPSRSGYGVYDKPSSNELDQNELCKKRGNWQYDFPKYLTLGTINKDISFSKRGTRELLQLILEQHTIGKVFIEPHLKNRLQLTNEKVRFHGCQAVRHDDHIHFQLR